MASLTLDSLLLLIIVHSFYLFTSFFLARCHPPGACHEGDPGVHHPTSAAHRENHAKCEKDIFSEQPQF